MIRRPPRSTQSRSSAASDVYKRQLKNVLFGVFAGGAKGGIKGMRYMVRRDKDAGMKVWRWLKELLIKEYGTMIGWTPKRIGAFCETLQQLFSETEPTYLAGNVSAPSPGVSTFFLSKAPKSWWKNAATMVYEDQVYCNAGLNTRPSVRAKINEPKRVQGCIKSLSLIHISEPTRPY
eukprot:TRINITY_DN7795_c0_g1_i1.p1 TRINITY_DN7795_c0_g1~~TRINITY_DN7795_c0_g1_i1.p1  ORF type:complete len:177 (+),score=72.67 TRINITY_DN7795_c0_g1_i1:48-578(+)